MDFTFISDEQFRESLMSDHREMVSCQSTEAWKCVQMLAGSIVEALLVEYLVVSSIRPNGKDPLTITLSEAIEACKAAKVLQASTASLCDVVRDYRNLIHPGRMIRLATEVTPESAMIAANLVALIRKEVAEKRKSTYGPTAEQLLRKIESDQHSLSVLPQLITETNEHERFKLADTQIPLAYFAIKNGPFSSEEALPRLRLAYRQAFDSLPEAKKTRLTEKFANLVREDSDDNIETFGEAFFLASDISFLKQQDAAIVTKYLTSRLERSDLLITEGLIRITAHIGEFLTLSEIPKLADTLARLVFRRPDQNAIELAAGIFDNLGTSEKKDEMERRGNTWVENGKKRNYPEAALKRLEELSSRWFNFPF